MRTIDLDDRVFGIKPNTAVVHQAVVTQQANARQGTHDTRTRGEVARRRQEAVPPEGHGLRPPGLQARAALRGGGVVFGPHPRSYQKAFPRKMRRLALRSVLSAKVAEDAVIIVDEFSLDAGKTKALLATLATLGADRRRRRGAAASAATPSSARRATSTTCTSVTAERPEPAATCCDCRSWC